MFQDPFLNYGIGHCEGFLTADCSTLHPLGEVVLHDNDIIVAVMGHLEGTHQIYGDSLIESPIGRLLQMTVSMDSGLALAADGAVRTPRLYVFLYAGPVEPLLDENLRVDYTLVSCQHVVIAG